MPLATYDDIVKDSVARDVQSRFEREIKNLSALGFQEEFYLRETLFPFSMLLFAPVVLLMIAYGERVGMRGLLQAVSYSPLMIHEDGHIYSSIMKLGVVYTTTFDDKTLLSTATFDNGTKSRPEYGYIRQKMSEGNMNSAWTLHTKRITRLEQEGRTAIAPLGMKDVIRLAMRENTLMMGGIPEDLKEKRKQS
jgi:hypothetical protein